MRKAYCHHYRARLEHSASGNESHFRCPDCGATFDSHDPAKDPPTPLPAPQPGGGGEAEDTILKGGETCAPSSTDSAPATTCSQVTSTQTAHSTGASNAEESTSNPSLHPPTTPIALPVRADKGFIVDANGVTLAMVLGYMTDGFTDRINAVVAALNSAAALSRELEELRAWKEEITGAIHRSGLGIMRTSQGPSGTLIGARPEVEEAEHKKVLELIRENVDLDLKVTALRAELEEAKAERDAAWRERANLREEISELTLQRDSQAAAHKFDHRGLSEIAKALFGRDDIGYTDCIREIAALRAAPRSEPEGRDKERWRQVLKPFVSIGKPKGGEVDDCRYQTPFYDCPDDLVIYEDGMGNNLSVGDIRALAALAHDEKGAGE